MGNHATRKKIAKLLKERGLGKLYYGNKNVAHRMLRGSWMQTLLYKLQFKVGDLVNDCDGYNHIITKIMTHYTKSEKWIGHERRKNPSAKKFPRAGQLGSPFYKNPSDYKWVGLKGTKVVELDQFEFGEGHWSCGCSGSPEAPHSREELESTMLEFLKGWEDREKYPHHAKMFEALNAGNHILDDQGILLPEFKEELKFIEEA